MVEAIILTETKASGVNGGGSTGGAWNDRALNNLTGVQSGNWCSLNTITGDFTLKTGKYLVTANAVVLGVGSNQLRIRNTFDNTSYYGTSSLSYSLTPSNSNNSSLSCYINVTATNRTFTLEHYCENSVPNFGKGVSVGASGNTEVYSTVVIQKL